jgi:hypothetical protein
MLKIKPTEEYQWHRNMLDVPLVLKAALPWLWAPPDAITEPMDALSSSPGIGELTEPMKTLILPETRQAS